MWYCTKIHKSLNLYKDEAEDEDEARAEICQTFGLFRRFEDTKILFSD